MSAAPLVYITGASSGIGRALASRYLRSGARVALVARRTAVIEAWLHDEGHDRSRVTVHAADLSMVEAAVRAGRECLDQQGLPDIVIANAGISVGVDTAEFEDLEVMQRTWAINNLGMAASFHPFLPAMRERGSGTLVGIASVAGIRGLPGHGAYCASKAGVISYCESLRGECRPYGIKVVTIAPGYVETPLTAGNRYAMPFRMTPADFADRALAAIASGDRFRVIPWQMAWVVRVLRAMPDAWFDRVMRGRPRKARQESGVCARQD